MEITGKIIQAFEPVAGVSQRGNNWKKREYVLETMETYPKKVFFDFFGERADQFPLNVGDTITLSFDIESREYNGRWFTSIRGWKAVPADPNAMPVAGVPAGYQQTAPQQQYAAPQQQYAPQQPYAPQPQAAPAPMTPPPGPMDAPAGDDLPF